MQYRAGSVTVQTGSNVVLGEGTEWLTNAPVGAPFTVEKDLVSYQVARVVTDTELRLSAPYEGPGGIDLYYSIHTSFTPKRNYPLLQPGDIEGLLILNRSIQMIDNDMPFGGATGAQALEELTDVDVAGAVTGYALIKQADGKWRGQAVASSSGVQAQNAGLATANSAAILKIVDGVLNLRRIVGDGITVTENPDSITLAPTAIGEVATMRNLGAMGSLGLFKQKINKEFQLFAFRAGTGVSLTQEGDEIVISSTVTGGGTGTVVSTTASNVGSGYVKLVKNKLNEDIKFRSISFDSQWFDATIDANQDTYTVKGKQVNINSLSGIDVTGAQIGTYLQLDPDGVFRAKGLPQLGIKSLSEDPAPKLTAPLDTAGQRILGVSRTKTVVIEKPRVRNYPLELSTPRNENLLTAQFYTEAGTVDFRAVVNGSGEDSEVTQSLIGTANTLKQTSTAQSPIVSPRGSFVDLKIQAVSVDASWLAVELTFISV